MNDNTTKILEDELKRAKIRLELVCQVHYEAATTERTFRRALEEAKQNNEPKGVVERMNGYLERAIATTKEAKAMVDEAEARCIIALNAIHEHNNPLNIPFCDHAQNAQTI